jgi:hypothetical protein
MISRTGVEAIFDVRVLLFVASAPCGRRKMDKLLLPDCILDRLSNLAIEFPVTLLDIMELSFTQSGKMK